MGIRDENNLLSQEERDTYHALLKLHGHEPQYFELEVREDQAPTDMNDIQYVVIIKVHTTHINTKKSKTYVSRAGSGTWLTEFEEDLKNAYFAG